MRKRYLTLLGLIGTFSVNAQPNPSPVFSPSFSPEIYVFPPTSLITPGSVYTNDPTQGGIFGFDVNLPVVPGQKYTAILPNPFNDIFDTSPSNVVLASYPGGVFIATTNGAIVNFNAQTANTPVVEQVYLDNGPSLVISNAAIYGTLIVSGNASITNITSPLSLGSTVNVANLLVTNTIDSRSILNSSSGPPINGSGLKELPNLMSVGSRLLPRLLAGTNPIVFSSQGDSMADTGGSFNGTAYYLERQLRYMFGNAGAKLAFLDGSFGPGIARWATNTLNMNVTAGGSIIFGSDGTNAARAIAASNLFCNSGGFWAWQWTNAGTVFAKMTNSSGTPTTISINLQTTNQATNGLLWHTNLPFANGSNTTWYFSATTGTNYIIGADFYQTNGGGIITADWNHGGYTITNVFLGMGTNNTAALEAGINPDLLMIHCRNNGIELQGAISNEFFIASMFATNVNGDCSVVLVYAPYPPGATGPTCLSAEEALAATGQPFFAFDLSDYFRTPATIGLWGWNPHPTANGGQLAAKIAYDAMGFGYNKGYTFSATNDGTAIFPSTSYNQTH